jgi:hypothetical protein
VLAHAASQAPEEHAAQPDPVHPAPRPEEDPFPRLQDRVIGQLGFVNNLLITLAVAVLAFAANALTDHAELRALGWRRWLITSGLVLLAVSVLTGIAVAHNRLSALRVSARTARLRHLRDRWRDQGRAYQFDRLRWHAAFFSKWGQPGLARKAASEHVRATATTLADALPDSLRKVRPWVSSDPAAAAAWHATTDLVDALRSWSDIADDQTWRWLRWQAGAFSVGALLLLVVALTTSS